MKKSNHMHGFTSTYQNIIFYSGKGGVHKTGAATHTAATALMLGAKLRLYEIDKQQLLHRLFPGHCTNVQLHGASELANRSSAHVRQLSPLFESMTSGDDSLVICDIGAGYEGAVFEAMLLSGCSQLLANGQRPTALVIPFDGSDEAIESAVVASQKGELILPTASQFFCAPYPDFTPATRASRQLWREHVAPHVERNGLFVLPTLGSDIYDLYTSAGLPPHEFARMDPKELASLSGEELFVARSSILQLSALTAAVARETERLFDFRKSDGTTV